MKLKLIQELKRLKEIVKRGDANQAVISRIVEIELLLDNIFYID